MWNSSTSAVQVNAGTSTNDPKTDTSNDTGTESLTWISWFCGLPGHEYFAEVAEDFIEDDFNLTGLNSMVPFYKEALEMILDVESEEETLKVPDVSIVETSAELLYGLIHQRYIITRQGLQQMASLKNLNLYIFPLLLNVSISIYWSDMPGLETVKLFCPSCLDLYTPPSSRFHNVDGFLDSKSVKKSRSGPRMQWLRLRPSAAEREAESHDQSEGGGENDDGEDDESVLGPGGGENNDSAAISSTNYDGD
ncbi:9041_t:CDS:2 [Dentiscutata erythropus]|uniref:Casein kinase II subunit beta n=1 Tax=Dentiscutata erythropus TaxID=1348616 RepID=A0A9N9G8L2_9GLOM|nr:9041_t:CDS:2 [Dentiscutata erythropus]